MSDRMREEEEAVIRAFIDRSKKARYLYKAERGRAFDDNLYHFADFDFRFLEPVDFRGYRNETIDHIFQTLRNRGAPRRCFVICTQDNLDGKEIELRTALQSICGREYGTILSCVPGKLAYHEQEGAHERYILHRP